MCKNLAKSAKRWGVAVMVTFSLIAGRVEAWRQLRTERHTGTLEERFCLFGLYFFFF